MCTVTVYRLRLHAVCLEQITAPRFVSGTNGRERHSYVDLPVKVAKAGGTVILPKGSFSYYATAPKRSYMSKYIPYSYMSYRLNSLKGVI